MKPDRGSPNLFARLRWSPLLALLAILPLQQAQAQYKIVGSDGKVTYTDRAPATSQGKITSLGVRAAPADADTALPGELREPVSRYPVTLFTITDVCEPCESARQLLRQRGVPYAEKQVQTAEDGEALLRLTGSRDAPALMIGRQTLRGLAPSVWGSYLDAAGYPRVSRLPPGYQYPAATPLTERREASVSAPKKEVAPQPAPSPATEPATTPNPAGIKF
ncbi:MAG: glutaredoxin family protein [Burkholderiaceae bacterium]